MSIAPDCLGNAARYAPLSHKCFSCQVSEGCKGMIEQRWQLEGQMGEASPHAITVEPKNQMEKRRAEGPHDGGPTVAPAVPSLDHFLDPDSLVAKLRKNAALVLEGANARQEGGSHYKDMGVQPWDVIDTWTLEQKIGFYRGNAQKYIMRMGGKDERLQEAKKARHYLDKLIEVLEAAHANP